jgi:hypothetical protein
MSENVGASTSRNPKGLHGLYKDKFTFTLPVINQVNSYKANYRISTAKMMLIALQRDRSIKTTAMGPV